MYKYCECGHSENDHADFGLRRCAKKGCACDQYIEDDDVIKWDGEDFQGGKMILGFFLVAAVLIVIIECLGKPTEVEADRLGRMHAPIDSAVLDSVHARGCPDGCTCALDGVILDCPDLKPTNPNGIRGAK